MICADPRFRDWLEARVGAKLSPDAQFIGRLAQGSDGSWRIVAAVGFSHYMPPDIELTLAAESGSGTRKLIDAVFDYVFEQMKCERCTIRIRASNTASIRLATRLGFVQEGRQRSNDGTRDTLIFGLLRNEHGQRWRRPRRTRSGSRAGVAEPVQPDEPSQPVRDRAMVHGRERSRNADAVA